MNLYVAALPVCRGYKPCPTLFVLSSALFWFGSNATVEFDGAGTTGKEQDVYKHAATAYYTVMVIMQFLESAWPCSKERLAYMPDYDLQTSDSE